MKQYNVTGMSCAACQARVEKAVGSIEGVESCAVNLLTNSMGVEGDVDPSVIMAAVEAAGYGASIKDGNSLDDAADSDESPEIIQIKRIRNRLTASVILLIPLMYVSMGHMMWNWPLPRALAESHIAMGVYELVLAGIIIVINNRFFVSGFKGLIHKSPNMDTLVALGATASYVYSIFSLISMNGDEFYFESAAMILTLITFGKLLEAKSKGKTTDALKSLMKLSPKTAVILVDGKESTVPVERVKVHDQFVVRPGDSIPVDGVVIEGESAINESALTGESIPVEKKPGSKVASATINTSGHLLCEATRVGEDTTLAGIIRMVSDAAATKAPIAKIADKVSGVFVPVVMAIALVTWGIWLWAGQSMGYAIARAVSVLVISCPCALGLATPVAIMVGNGVGAKSGILFKTAASLEQAGKTQILALDKTGTVTTGQMKVTDVAPISDSTDRELIEVAYALETKSEHPISKAITQYALEHDIKLNQTKDFTVVSGNGLRGSLNNELIAGGNAEYIESITKNLDEQTKKQLSDFAKEGKTPVLFVRSDKLLGIIAVADTIKEDSCEAVEELKQMGIRVVMLTGDNEVTANAIAKQAGIDEVMASLKPDGKEKVIRELRNQGRITMVGDGINDAPALTSADLGIAIGAGTDIAIDAADVVLMKNSIKDVAAAIRISRHTLKNIHENLFWAFFYNCLGIPLAAGCFIKAFGLTLSPMFGAAAMGLSSFCVVSNALRLNLIKPYGEKTIDRKKDTSMKITVNGMMCAHCEAHVTKALLAIEGIENVVASHADNLVTFDNTGSVDEAVIKAAIEEAGYEYVSH